MKEGIYTAWTHKWTNALPDGLWDPSFVGFLLDDKDDLLIITWRDGDVSGDHWNRFGVFDLSDFSQVFVSPSGQDYSKSYPEIDYSCAAFLGNADLYGGLSRTLQTYIFFLRNSGLMEVWSGGGSTPLWSRDPASDANLLTTYGHGAISSAGKWILYLGYKDPSPGIWLLCYEGS